MSTGNALNRSGSVLNCSEALHEQPKAMSMIQECMTERISMPDYMAEQMPEMMPRVMENLMPHMIGDVVSLVTQPLIDYLRGNSA